MLLSKDEQSLASEGQLTVNPYFTIPSRYILIYKGTMQGAEVFYLCSTEHLHVIYS